MPRFQPHQPSPPSSSPLPSKSWFVTRHFSNLTTPLLPPPPCSLLPYHSPAHSSPVPSPDPFRSASPSSSPPGSESLFVTCHVSNLTNPLLPLPPLQRVSPRL